MSADKYPNIFSRQMEAIVYILSMPILVKIVIIKLPHKSVFSATVVLFISLLCIVILLT